MSRCPRRNAVILAAALTIVGAASTQNTTPDNPTFNNRPAPSSGPGHSEANVKLPQASTGPIIPFQQSGTNSGIPQDSKIPNPLIDQSKAGSGLPQNPSISPIGKIGPLSDPLKESGPSGHVQPSAVLSPFPQASSPHGQPTQIEAPQPPSLHPLGSSGHEQLATHSSFLQGHRSLTPPVQSSVAPSGVPKRLPVIQPEAFLGLNQGHGVPGHLKQLKSPLRATGGSHVPGLFLQENSSPGLSHFTHHALSSHSTPLFQPSDHSSYLLRHGYIHGSYGQECGEGKVVHVDERCVTPQVTHRQYVARTPKLPHIPTSPVVLPPPRLIKNILYVRTPEKPPPPPPIILPPLEKNVVYLFGRRQQQQQQRVIQAPSPLQQSPDVYYVDYAAHENPKLPHGGDLHTALSLVSLADDEATPTSPQYSNNRY